MSNSVDFCNKESSFFLISRPTTELLRTILFQISQHLLLVVSGQIDGINLKLAFLSTLIQRNSRKWQGQALWRHYYRIKFSFRSREVHVKHSLLIESGIQNNSAQRVVVKLRSAPNKGPLVFGSAGVLLNDPWSIVHRGTHIPVNNGLAVLIDLGIPLDFRQIAQDFTILIDVYFIVCLLLLFNLLVHNSLFERPGSMVIRSPGPLFIIVRLVQLVTYLVGIARSPTISSYLHLSHILNFVSRMSHCFQSV